MAPTYSDLLKHPRWQKKRLGVLSRSGFACENCGSKDKTLHVHHGYYEHGMKPWEYPEETLFCFCKDCHWSAQTEMAYLHKTLALLDSGSREVVLGFAIGIQAAMNWHFGRDTTILVHSIEFAEGLGYPFGLDPSQVLKLVRNGTVTVRRMNGLAEE